MKNILKNIKNPILVSSLISTTFLILSSLNIIKIPNETINAIVNLVMTILSILGVLNTENN